MSKRQKTEEAVVPAAAVQKEDDDEEGPELYGQQLTALDAVQKDLKKARLSSSASRVAFD